MRRLLIFGGTTDYVPTDNDILWIDWICKRHGIKTVVTAPEWSSCVNIDEWSHRQKIQMETADSAAQAVSMCDCGAMFDSSGMETAEIFIMMHQAKKPVARRRTE